MEFHWFLNSLFGRFFCIYRSKRIRRSSVNFLNPTFDRTQNERKVPRLSLCHAHDPCSQRLHSPPHLSMASTPPPKAATTAEPAVEKTTPPSLKKDHGIVKSVLSGDTLVVLDDKPNPQGPPAEKIVTLSSLSAPRMARGDATEEVLWHVGTIFRSPHTIIFSIHLNFFLGSYFIFQCYYLFFLCFQRFIFPHFSLLYP
jgi:hypothetical protein